MDWIVGLFVDSGNNRNFASSRLGIRRFIHNNQVMILMIYKKFRVINTPNTTTSNYIECFSY